MGPDDAEGFAWLLAHATYWIWRALKSVWNWISPRG